MYTLWHKASTVNHVCRLGWGRQGISVHTGLWSVHFESWRFALNPGHSFTLYIDCCSCCCCWWWWRCCCYCCIHRTTVGDLFLFSPSAFHFSVYFIMLSCLSCRKYFNFLTCIVLNKSAFEQSVSFSSKIFLLFQFRSTHHIVLFLLKLLICMISSSLILTFVFTPPYLEIVAIFLSCYCPHHALHLYCFYEHDARLLCKSFSRSATRAVSYRFTKKKESKDLQLTPKGRILSYVDSYRRISFLRTWLRKWFGGRIGRN